MKLSILAKLHRSIQIISSNNQKVALESKVYLHFYNPIGGGDWYVMATKRSKIDWIYFGVILINTPRFGTFTLNELKKKKLPFGYKIQLDERFEPQSWKKVMASKNS